MSRKLASVWLLLLAAAVVIGPGCLNLDPATINPEAVLRSPSGAHWLGTDALGRDVGLRVWAGARVSILVALLATALATAVGGVLGALAGGFGGRTDMVINGVTEAVLAVPKLPLLLLFASVDVFVWGPNLEPGQLSALRLSLVIASLGWMSTTRVVRASAARVKSESFVTAARGFGATAGFQMRQHIVPHILGSWLAVAVLELGDFVIYESVLSFLGLGVLPPMASWGTALTEALAHIDEAPWLFVAPGVVTLFTIAALHVLSEQWIRNRARG